jgi:thiol-disulfide isomerase/thioredoxin
MNHIKIIFFSLFLLLFVSEGKAQYRIELSVPQSAKDTLLFGHYFRTTLILKDSFYMDEKGVGIIQGEESLPGGLYTIYFPSGKRIDLLMDKDQEFSISSDPENIAESTHFKGSKNNELFYEYLARLNERRTESQNLQTRVKTPISENDSIAARKKLEKLNMEMEEYINNLIEKHPDLFLSKFLLAMKDVEVPDPPRDENGALIDSSFYAKYYRKHYFDNFDVSDVRLLRTPLYENKLKTFLDKWTYPVPDSIYKDVDWLIEESRADTFLFKYMLTTLFNHYVSSKYTGMDAIYTYIAEKYYIPEATWSSEEFINELKERVKVLKPILIGKTAPDVELVSVSDQHFQLAREDSALKRNPYVGERFMISEVKGDYTLLYFWEADCGHCRKSLPQLYELWQEMQSRDIDLRVIAVSMLGGIEGKVKWIDFINEHGLYGWVNAWNPYDFAYKDIYDLKSSNILYLLDDNHEIVAKNIGPEQAEKLIESLQRK